MQAGQVTSLSHWHVFQIQLDKLVNPGLSKEEMKAATTGTGMKKKKERKKLLSSHRLTCFYAEKSSSSYIYAPLDTTLGELRDKIHTNIKSALEVNWGERDAIHPDTASIMISASKKEVFS